MRPLLFLLYLAPMSIGIEAKVTDHDLFSDMQFNNTRFVMLHAGYPWWSLLEPLLEKKNVYVDFCSQKPYWESGLQGFFPLSGPFRE